MKISADKTKVMLFKTKRQKCRDELVININNLSIENVKEFKYLGLLLNPSLSFDKHYDKVCKNMCSRIHLLRRYKKYFNEKWRVIFATSLVLSLLEYCLPVWGNLSETQLERIDSIIVRLAKQAVLNNCIVAKKREEKHSIVEKLNWLLVREKLFVFTVDFIKKNIINDKSTLRSSFTQFQSKNHSNDNSSRSQTLRNSLDFEIPRMKTEFGKSSFYYTGVKAWNKIPNEIKEVDNFNRFDAQIRQFVVKERDNDFKYF